MPIPRNAQVTVLFPAPESKDFALVAAESLNLPAARRALIAARLSKRPQGYNKTGPNDREPTILELAKAFNISDGVIQRARRVLRDGTQEDVERIERGECGISEVVRRIWMGKRLMQPGSQEVVPQKRSRSVKPKRAEKKHQDRYVKTEIWNTLRDALYGLTSMPRVSDVLTILTGGGKCRVVDEKLPMALKFLQELQDERTKRSTKGRKNGKGSADAGNGQ